MAQNLLLWVQIDKRLDYQKEEVMEVKDLGGIPEDLLEEFQVGKDMLFRLNSLEKVSEGMKGSLKSRETFGGSDEDPMWSSSSALPSDWLFGDE